MVAISRLYSNTGWPRRQLIKFDLCWPSHLTSRIQATSCECQYIAPPRGRAYKKSWSGERDETWPYIITLRSVGGTLFEFITWYYVDLDAQELIFWVIVDFESFTACFWAKVFVRSIELRNQTVNRGTRLFPRNRWAVDWLWYGFA